MAAVKTRMMNVILQILTAGTPRILKRPCAKLNGPGMRYLIHEFYFATNSTCAILHSNEIILTPWVSMMKQEGVGIATVVLVLSVTAG